MADRLKQRALDRYRLISEWAGRHIAPLIAASFVLLAISFVLLAVAFGRLSREADRRSSVDRARTAQVDWDAQAARHRACLARADSQVASREAWRVAVVLLSAPRPGESPGRRAETVQTVAVLNVKLDEALAPQDCSKVSPQPKGPRPKIP